jgi:hypothetical protein
MKAILITVFMMLFAGNLFAQDVVSVAINGKKIGEAVVTETPAVINVNKAKFKNIKALTVMVKQAAANNVYKRTLQITNEPDSVLYQVNESSKRGSYKINLSVFRLKILNQKIIKVYLAENPANSMMRILSKRTLLAEIHATK